MTEFWGTASFRAQGHKEKKQSRGQRKSHQREREKKIPRRVGVLEAKRRNVLRRGEWS